MDHIGIFLVFLLSISIKLLLLNSRHSTDFEVHRNWLSITSNYPLIGWYSDTKSIWTLDYPPLFAYFEMTLGTIAKYLYPSSSFWRPESHLNSDFDCRLFQKASVIISDCLLFYIIYRKWRATSSKSLKRCLMILSIFPALIIIDHLHFQYNGFLIGIFLMCCDFLYQGELLIGSLLFSILLCFKHIFIIFSPLIGLYVFRTNLSKNDNMISDFLIILFGCIKAILIPFFPFIINGQLQLLISRLFPLQRGLLHSYWAPNFWAVYAAMDLFCRRIFLHYPELYFRIFETHTVPPSSLCNGLTGEKSFSIFPNISPIVSICLIALIHIPIALKLWRAPTPKKFINFMFISGLISFFFGYHIHEKASIPFLALALCFDDSFDAHSKISINNILVASTTAMIPLVQAPAEAFIAVILVILLILVLNQQRFSVISAFIQISPLVSFVFLKIFSIGGQFLPYLIMAVSCALIVGWNGAKLYITGIYQN